MPTYSPKASCKRPLSSAPRFGPPHDLYYKHSLPINARAMAKHLVAVAPVSMLSTMSSWPFSSHSSGTRAVAHFLTYSSYPPQAPPPPQTEDISSRPQALKIRTRKRARSHVVSPDPTPPQLRPRQQHADAIHSLPLEILTEILLFSASLEYPLYEGFLPPALPLKFMLVCRRWHGLVLATAKFWRSIEMTPQLDRISLLLERSGDCPLDVRICHPWAVDPEAVTLLVPHAHRVRSVVARLSLYKGHFEMIRPLFDAGMPLLERLELVPVDDTLRRRGTPAIDFGLSSSTTPLLTSLIVGHVAFPQASGLWQTLRVLKLHTRPWEYLGEREGQRFLDVLAQNPLLEELYVWASLGTPPDGLPPEGRCLPTVQLPRLRIFSMNGTSTSLSFLLSRMQIPSDIPSFDLRIACDAPSEAGHALPAHFRPILDRMAAVTLTQWSCEGKLTLASPHSPWPHTVRDTLTIGLSSSAAPLHVQDMSRVLSFVPVRSLALRTFDGFPRQDTAAWADFLEAYPELRELRATTRYRSLEGISTLVEALQPISFCEKGRGEREGVARCSSLARLSAHGSFPDSKQSCEVLGTLAECIIARAQSGSSLEQLDLHFWHTSDEPLHESLRTLFTRVRDVVGHFVCKFGQSAGCGLCH